MGCRSARSIGAIPITGSARRPPVSSQRSSSSRDGSWHAAFQSRFGRAEWLQPYTATVLDTLARQGRRVDVVCPGFVADCLETLEEIGIEGRAAFRAAAAGGGELRLLPCLNDRPGWIEALVAIVRDGLGSWIGETGDGASGRRRCADAATRDNPIGSGRMRLIVHWIINAAALFVLPYIVSSIRLKDFVTALVVALLLGLVNAIIRPILILLTLPVTILTLGAFILVINALLFWAVGSLLEGFQVGGFWSAFWGSIVYSLISWAAAALLLPKAQPT